MDQFYLQLAIFNRIMELFASRHSREERAHDSNSSNTGPKDGNPEEEKLEAIRASQMSYEHTLNGCLEASALRFLGLEASLRRIEVHLGAIMEVMQGKERQKFLSPPMLEEATTIPWNGENVEHNYFHNFANESSTFIGEKVGEEETNVEMKESKPYVPPIISQSRLLKSIWNTPVDDKYFQDLIVYKRIFKTLEFS
ncbi:hypothetical protein QYF36_020701 [Acer negundo]|nr:hypothetical protein QYF36_020701 [Acer negundo]